MGSSGGFSPIADGQWHYFYRLTRINETYANPLIADGPSWQYSTQAGELFITGMMWEKIAPTSTILTYAGSAVPITATPNAGYHFVSWAVTDNPSYISIANSGAASTTISATSSMPQGGTGIVTASFAVTPLTGGSVIGASVGKLNTAYTFTANCSGGSGTYTYAWNGGETGSTKTYSWGSTGAQSVSVTITDVYNGLQVTPSTTCTIYSAPTVVVTGPAAGKLNTDYTFTATPSGGLAPYTYSWGSNTIVQNWNINSWGVGAWTGHSMVGGCGVTVTDNLGQTSIMGAAYITIYDAPVVSISGPTSGNINTGYAFTDTVVGGMAPYTYAWDYMSYYYSTNENPHTSSWSSPGTYYQYTTAYDALGQASNNPYVTITIAPASIDISAAGVTGFVAPVKGAVPIGLAALTANAATYTKTSLVWAPANNPYLLATIYTATVKLTSAAGYKFPAGGLMPTVNTGTPSTGTVEGGDVSGNTLTFTVTFPATATFTIGQSYGGGKIAYIDSTGLHGLIAAVSDQATGIIWAITAKQGTLVGGTGTGINWGSANTYMIITQNGAGSTYAAGKARAYTGGGYTDWWLPSKDELWQLYINRAAIGGFAATGTYWSSSEANAWYAWKLYFSNGSQSNTDKYQLFYVRAVRGF